ncbi:CHAT domain containing protein [Hyaloscypha variabilis]
MANLDAAIQRFQEALNNSTSPAIDRLRTGRDLLTLYAVDERYKAGQKLEEKIQIIRTLAGFDRFLLALVEDELKSVVEYGPIVVVNLWDTIAHPVLNALGFTKQPSDGCWPRVWWIPTGLLNKFPLHAAGHHTKGSDETVLNRVVLSYSSKFSTPSTPQEVKMLRGLCQSMGLEPVEFGRRKQDVMSNLPHCNIFHFASHGYTNNDDPLKSYLLLKDGKSNALTVANLLGLNLREQLPFLAYLSACETGRTKGEKFVDENVNLISACQLAGYRHVIGTLLEVKDEICVEVARITYKAIRDKGMTDELVAWELHKAARELRDRRLSMPVTAERGRKSGGEGLTSLGIDKVDADFANNGDQRDVRLPRDIVSWDNDNRGVGLWVPYVHFGV